MFADQSINIDMPASRTFSEPPAEVMQTLEACPICRSDNIEEWMADINARRPTTYWNMCFDCTHIFLNPVPSKKWIDNYYVEGYRQDTDGNTDPEKVPAPAVQAEATRGMRQANTLMRFANRIDRVLDIGSSSGVGIASTFDRYAVKKGVGVEPNDCYRAFAEEMSKNAPELPGKVKFVEKLSKVPKSPKFDFVRNSHVLEHVHNPVKMLISNKQYLLARGLMYVEVPYVFGGIISPLLFPHLHAFTEESLTTCIEAAGLFVHHLEHVHMSGHPHWPSPRSIFAIVKKKPLEVTVDTALEKFNAYRFHAKFLLQQIEAAKNPMAKFG